MKKTVITSVLVLTFCSLFSQEKDTIKGSEYNKWSVEFNVGSNKASKPYSTGYFSSNGKKYFNFSNVNHFDIGVRRMLSTKFGVKFDFASDNISNQKGSGSLPFETQQYRIGLQGVMNLARVLAFEDFTQRFGLLAHAGIQVAQLTSKYGVSNGITEDNGGIIYGLTPQIRITDKLVFTGDFTVLSNIRQHLNWDGSTSAEDNNLTGEMFNTSIGLTYYFGNKQKHADWYVPVPVVVPDPEVIKRLKDIDILMTDTDRDGIVDHLDVENNTPAGVATDSKGRFIDVNLNGVPDEMDPKPKDGIDGVSKELLAKNDAIKTLIEKGFVNLFYDLNKDEPNVGSTNNVYYIIKFLKSNPTAKASLMGYADFKGSAAYNLKLSERRVKNIYNIIVSNGIDPIRVTVLGNGVDKDYTTDTKTGLSLARRVSIILE
jgi:OOP family OmpA-OmpF porin